MHRNVFAARIASALVLASAFFVSPRVGAQELTPKVELMAGFGTPVGFGGVLGGVDYGKHLSAVAGVGGTGNGPQFGLHLDAYPVVGTRWSFGLRGSLSVGRFADANCISCVTFHKQLRWKMKWTPAAFVGLAAVARYRASDSVSLTWHLGVSQLVNAGSGTCTYELDADSCEAATAHADNFTYADLGMTIAWNLSAWDRE